MTGAREVGAGVEAREELAVLDPRPLVPFRVEGVIGVGRLTPHDDPTAGFGVDFGLPRVGKSPSERRFGGFDDSVGRLEEDEGGKRGSGRVSASN
jgi:hypothetical protein